MIDFRAIHCAGWKKFYVDADNDTIGTLKQAEIHNDFFIESSCDKKD